MKWVPKARRFFCQPHAQWNNSVLPRFGRHRECRPRAPAGVGAMNGIIYLVGLIVIIMFILSFLGLR
jgi:hypothetical protein